MVKGTSMLLYLYSPIGDQFREAVNEIQPIIIEPEHLASFDPPDNHKFGSIKRLRDGARIRGSGGTLFPRRACE